MCCGEALDLDWCMRRFRLASRELFNHYFADPGPDADYRYQFYDGFNYVENALFKKMVLAPAKVPVPDEYELGYDSHPNIRVCLPQKCWSSTIMLNRELSSGYWDYPVTEFTDEAIFLFLEFFDFGGMDVRDHQYVKIEVKDWLSHPECIGKFGLIEAKNVRYALYAVEKA
jgi:hypothetical protein